MYTIDSVNYIDIVYKGKKNTVEGIMYAYEKKHIDEELKNELLSRHALSNELMREVA